MPLPDDYLSVLEQHALVFAEYHRRAGTHAVLVGGAATMIYTAGAFASADFDVVAPASELFDEAMLAHGFRHEDRPGHLRVGFYHADYPGYGFQQVSGRLFDGRADMTRLFVLSSHGQGSIALPSVEDMIADRLGQHAFASPSDDSRLRQAVRLFQMAEHIDAAYLNRRVREEGGDPTLLPGLTEDGTDD